MTLSLSQRIDTHTPAHLQNKWLPKIKAWIDENTPGDKLIPFSVALEERLAGDFNDPAAQEEELKRLGTTGALGKITSTGYQSLHVRLLVLGPMELESDLSVHVQLIRYFTCGPQEVRAWTIREGTKAPQAAGVIQCVICPNYPRKLSTYQSLIPAVTLRSTSSVVRSSPSPTSSSTGPKSRSRVPVRPVLLCCGTEQPLTSQICRPSRQAYAEGQALRGHRRRHLPVRPSPRSPSPVAAC